MKVLLLFVSLVFGCFSVMAEPSEGTKGEEKERATAIGSGKKAEEPKEDEPIKLEGVKTVDEAIERIRRDYIKKGYFEKKYPGYEIFKDDMLMAMSIEPYSLYVGVSLYKDGKLTSVLFDASDARADYDRIYKK